MIEILIADDEPMNREVLREFLEAQGYSVCEAVDGLEACELAAARRPVLILMDIRMPRADGFAALEHLRANPTTACIPVIAITAFAMASDRKQAEDAGFDSYITKPVDFAKLNEIMARMVK